MSDELPASASAGVPASSAVPADDAAQFITITCPACAAVLRKIKAEPGAGVRCLNCGHRFTLESNRGKGILPVSTHGLEAHATGVSPVEAQPDSAQPRSAGYWLLRIPGVIGSFAALAVTLFVLYEMIRYRFFLSRPLLYLSECSYVPLLALGGLFWLFLTRALARVDSGAVYLGWRSGAIAHSLPPAPGSSLPYVAPVAVAGGILPILILAVNRTDDIGSVLAAGLVGGGFFYLGFMLEDVRQFCWRQEQLARACFRAAGGQERESHGLPYCGLFLGGAALLAALAIFMVLLERLRYRWNRESVIPLFFSFGFAGIAYSLYLLGRDWDRAVAWWELAAAQRTTAGTRSNTDRRLSSGSMAYFCLVPWLWVFGGAFFLCLMLAKHGRPHGVPGICCLCSAAAAFAFWLSVFLPQVKRWRAAQERFWLLWQPEAKPQSVPQPRWQWWIVWGTVWLALIQAVLFSLMMLGNVFQYKRLDAEMLLGFPLLVVLMHYPTMWCALLLREFLALERFYGTRRQALSSGEEE